MIDKMPRSRTSLCYFVDTLGPAPYPARWLYRVWTNDGHEEMVRGAIFNELDTRALRSDLAAAGSDSAGQQPATVFPSPPSSALRSCFVELEVKTSGTMRKEKLPDYPAPTLSSGRN